MPGCLCTGERVWKRRRRRGERECLVPDICSFRALLLLLLLLPDSSGRWAALSERLLIKHGCCGKMRQPCTQVDARTHTRTHWRQDEWHMSVSSARYRWGPLPWKRAPSPPPTLAIAVTAEVKITRTNWHDGTLRWQNGWKRVFVFVWGRGHEKGLKQVK